MNVRVMAGMAVAAMLLTAGSVQADVFNMGPGLTSLQMVTVGDPGNAADMRVQSDGTSGYGSVPYTYNIGKYEVTAGQYTAFLNAVAKTDTYRLFNSSMSDIHGCGITQSGSSGIYSYSVASLFANRPVNCVSFLDACRFTNWLNNGQPTGLQGNGTTETGTYTLNGYNGMGGGTIQRNPGSTWAVTSEDEWYKAAYYRGGSTNAGYWDYPTCSNTPPGNDMADASGNNANSAGSSPLYTTIVGQFQNSPSPYGTFDQGGNVWEWNEGIVVQDPNFPARGLRGGSFNVDYGHYDDMSASYRGYHYYGNFVYDVFGFRVAEVPEPATLALLALAGLAMLRRRK